MANFSISFQNKSGKNVSESRLRHTAEFVMSELRLHPRTQLDIMCIGLEQMERLHLDHMDEPGATDVLSFPMDELRAPQSDELALAGMLGEVVLCPEFAAVQAEQNEVSLDSELDLLLTHGILHLLGHDHAEPEEHAVMFGLQAQLLQQLGRRRGEVHD